MTLGVPAIDPDKFPTADALSAEMTKYLDLCRIFYANGGRERVIARQKRLYERDIERFALFCRRVTQENIKK